MKGRDPEQQDLRVSLGRRFIGSFNSGGTVTNNTLLAVFFNHRYPGILILAYEFGKIFFSVDAWHD